MDLVEIFEYLQSWTYRVGGFVVMNVLDDAAWLALMFC